MNKEQRLHDLSKEIHRTQLPLSEGNLVMGRGNPNAPIVLIGEAPGKEEDKLGKPFVGKSGQLLDKLLVSAGFSIHEYYITNIVKYRPPQNRDPKKSEVALFKPYLLRELDIIRPRYLGTLGRHALSCFLPKGKISLVHGQVLPLPSCQFQLVPLYHPAAALYDPRLLPTLVKDLEKLAKEVFGEIRQTYKSH